MTAKFEYKGYWYLPHQQDNAVAGILTYIPNEKLNLELIGNLGYTKDDIIEFFKQKRVNIIWGETSEAKKVTLLNCFSSGVSYHNDCSFPIINYSIQYCLVGYHHLEKFEEKVFNWCHVEMPTLTTWCFPGSIKKQLYRSTDKKSIDQLSVSFSSEEMKDPIVSVPINESTILNLMRDVKLHDEHYIFSFEQSTFLKIQKNQKTSTSEFLKDIYQFENFMSLATLSKLNASKIVLFDDTKLDNNKSYYPTELFYWLNNPESEPKNRHSFLFDYTQIKDLFNDIIIKWYNDTDQIIPIRRHLVQSLERNRIFSSVDFLIIIQAIDGFYCRFREDVRSLEKIMRDILKEFEDIKKVKELNINIDEVIDSRHYYSHFMNKSKKPKTLEGEALYILTQKLRIILICCVLKHSGFCNKDIDHIFCNSFHNIL
ncbi:MAG TPA: hypothetical protein PLI77_09930 [Bacteroidales bacterium]|jgi:hypothetical protein|nr:hypothetical protein [Bacteroidales bacterium]